MHIILHWKYIQVKKILCLHMRNNRKQYSGRHISISCERVLHSLAHNKSVQ
uniref:Uncharacterized protein n=1 Tax=Anguilla anguilla TaxID=7936 RepID=A0A0E9UZW2_ANGAN